MIDVLSKVFEVRHSHFKSRLSGVNGYTGKGVIEFSSYRSGERNFLVKLSGIAGLTVDLHLNEDEILPVPINNGRAHYFLDSRKENCVPELTGSTSVKIYQNDNLILEGTLD